MKWYVILFGFLLAVSSAEAARVGVVADIGSDTYVDCISIAEGKSGYDLIEDTALDALWSDESDFGHSLCKVEGIGDDVSGTICDWGDDYWNFNIVDDGSWEPSPVGYDGGSCWNRDLTSWGGHYCTRDGDVIGLAYGGFLSEPDYYDFDDICDDPLFISELVVEVNGDKDRGADEYGGDFEVIPGDSVLITITLENLADYEITSLLATLEIDNVGDDDISEDSDEYDLRESDEEDLELSFAVPLDAKDKTYDVTIQLEAKDDFRTKISKTILLEMDVQRERHDVQLLAYTWSSTSYSCQDYARLSVELANLGKEDEDLIVSLFSDALGIRITESLELEYDISRPEIVELAFPLDNVRVGSHPLILQIASDDYSASETVFLQKEKCASSGARETAVDASAKPITPSLSIPPSTQPVKSSPPIDDKLDLEWWLFAAGILAVGLVIIIVGLAWVLRD